MSVYYLMIGRPASLIFNNHLGIVTNTFHNDIAHRCTKIAYIQIPLRLRGQRVVFQRNCNITAILFNIRLSGKSGSSYVNNSTFARLSKINHRRSSILRLAVTLPLAGLSRSSGIFSNMNPNLIPFYLSRITSFPIQSHQNTSCTIIRSGCNPVKQGVFIFKNRLGYCQRRSREIKCQLCCSTYCRSLRQNNAFIKFYLNNFLIVWKSRDINICDIACKYQLPDQTQTQCRDHLVKYCCFFHN